MTYLFHGGNLSPCVHKLAHDTTLLELQCFFFSGIPRWQKFWEILQKFIFIFFSSNVTCGAPYRAIVQTRSKTNCIFKVVVLMFLI